VKGEPVVPPVHLSATYRFGTSDEMIDVVQTGKGFLYSRWDNPSVVEAEKAMAGLEGYERALGFASGMAAVTTAIMASLRGGDRIVATRQLYGATYEFLSEVLPGLSIETVFVDCWDVEGLKREIGRGASIVYLETPTNPLLRVVDVPELAAAAHRRKATVVLDSTFASPVNQHPLDMEVDIVVHSATKYLGGHHDVTAGFACCQAKQADRLWRYRKITGGIMDPMSAFLVLRGMQTLALRIRQQNASAMKIAEFLQTHEKVRKVHYPGLSSHPDHIIARRQMSGFGGMLSFELDGDFQATKSVMDRLQVIKLATSLGGVSSLANQPITNTHAALNPEDRARAGIAENLVRLSVGIEPVERLVRDLEQALAI
jgi:cystathionine beta-lyase/cystathionine gamma-synthase